MAKKKIVRVSDGRVKSSTALISRLRDIELPPRTREHDREGAAILWPVQSPWDAEAAEDDPPAVGLVPLDSLSASALALRQQAHGSAEDYAAKMKEIRDELETCAEQPLVAVAIGANKVGRKLDRDVWIWMAWEIIKYRRRFPKGESKQNSKRHYGEWKQAMYQRMEVLFPDLSPDNRVFSSLVAEMKWTGVSCHSKYHYRRDC